MKPRLDQIRAVAGTIYAHVFENRTMGVPRGLYWNLRLDCELGAPSKRPAECSISIDWLTFAATRFEQLSAVGLASVRDPRGIEASIYLGTHRDIRLRTLEFGVASSSVVQLRVAGDLAEPARGQDPEHCRIDLTCDIEFEGVVVVPQSLVPKPGSVEEARAAIAPYFELETLASGDWEDFRYLFPPIRAMRILA
jgi:hypothetical protein